MTLTNDFRANRIHPHIPHLAARMKAAGYRTALCGVQHEAAHEHVAAVMGLDEQFATDPWPGAGQQVPLIRRYLSQAGREPFFLQVGTFEAHLGRTYTGKPPRNDEPYPPVQDRSNGLSVPGYLVGSEADEETVATLQGLLNRGDRVVGAVLDGLTSAGLAGNTIVMMCVDHGVGLTRAKTTCYDAGTRTAWVVRWPASIPADTVVDVLATHVDVTPTLLGLLGLPVAEPLDGRDLSRHVRGEARHEVRDAVYCHMEDTTRSVRTTRWRLVRHFEPYPLARSRGDCASQHRGFAWTPPPIDESTLPHVQLFDAQADPDHLTDLAEDPTFAAIRTELDDRLWAFLHEQGDSVLTRPVRTAWHAMTRAGLESFCVRSGRVAPRAVGPHADPIDAASARGAVWPSIPVALRIGAATEGV